MAVRLLARGGSAASERHWRNWQRMSRNLARSSGEPGAVQMFTVDRWLRELRARCHRSTVAKVHPGTWDDAPSLAWLSHASDRLASALLDGPDAGAPLRHCAGVDARPPSEDSVGFVYDAFASGAL